MRSWRRIGIRVRESNDKFSSTRIDTDFSFRPNSIPLVSGDFQSLSNAIVNPILEKLIFRLANQPRLVFTSEWSWQSLWNVVQKLATCANAAPRASGYHFCNKGLFASAQLIGWLKAMSKQTLAARLKIRLIISC